MRGRARIAIGLAVIAAVAILVSLDLTHRPALADEGVVAPVVGEIPAPGAVQMIDNLGAVGLGPELTGSRYAVVAGHLVRIDSASGKILSVLRSLPRAPD